MYENLSGMPLKGAASPYLPEGSIPVNEWEERRALASDASKVLMKVLWAGRPARPGHGQGNRGPHPPCHEVESCR